SDLVPLLAMIGVMQVADFFFQAEDGIRDRNVTGVQTCALPISARMRRFGDRRDVLHLEGQRARRFREDHLGVGPYQRGDAGADQDRKSTRLNSSHVSISYAVFCLKKKKRSTRIR